MKFRNLLLVVLLGLAAFTSLVVLMPSGSRYCFDGICGVYFWGANEHDGIWHLAVINTLLGKYPFEMPNMSGMLIRGYNYLLDFVIAILTYITPIASPTWFFKIQPVAWFISFVYALYLFAQSYKKSPNYFAYLIFFSFFGSSFSYVLQILNRGTLWGSSSLLSMQAALNLLNPQFAWSLIPLLLLLRGLNIGSREIKDYFKYGLLIAIAVGLKFYTGAVMCMILGFDLIWQLSTKKEKFASFVSKGLISALLVIASVFVFYNPGISGDSPFILKPMAPVNPIIEDKSLLYLPIWAERLYNYSGIKLWILELLVLGIFVFFNFGSRILALCGYLINHKKEENTYPRILVIFGSVVSLLLAVLLVQRGVWWNTVQFLYVSLFLVGILAAESIEMIAKQNKYIGNFVVASIVIITIPGNLDVLHTFARTPGNAYIPDEELVALEYLKDWPHGVILTPTFAHRPQYTITPTVGNSYDTAYVSAYTHKQSYLTDIIQLDLTNIDYRSRLSEVNGRDCHVLTQVDYAYEYKGNEYLETFKECGSQVKRIFENNLVNIYQID